jgi:tetratricopeptide (TPR) repeat protein
VGPLGGATLIGLLVLMIPLARGGVDLWTEAAAVLLAVGAAALVADDAASVPRSALALLTVVALILLQVLPVPALVHRLSPGAGRIFETSLAPLGLYPAARPLSLDPAASARELGKAIACLATFFTSFAVSSTHRRKRRLLLSLGFSGFVLSAAVLGLALTGAGTFVAPHFPFVNRNHLAAALNLSLFVAVGLALEAHGQRRVLWLLGVATSCMVLVLTLSRGGLFALVFGLSLFAGWFARSHRSDEHRFAPVRLGLAVVTVCLAVAAAAYLGLEPLLAKLETVQAGASDVRWQLLRPAAQVLRDFPLAGVGRGAFPDVFAGYQLESATYEFTHVENEWLQALLDLGIVGGALLIGTFAWTWLAAARRHDLALPEIGLLAGTAAVAVHNLVDFSLGFLGVALPFSAAMGLLAKGQRSWPVPVAKLRVAAVLLAVFAFGGLLIASVHGREADEDLVERAVGGSATIAAARAAVEWHPSDWLPHAAAGVRLAAERNCAEAMPWLSRAMILYPSAPSPHLAAARCLAGHDDAAARRELRLAILFGADALNEAVLRYPRIEHLFEIAPDTPQGLISLGDALAPFRPADAKIAYLRALEGYSEDRALLPLARLSATLGDLESALAFARRHQETFRSDPAGYAVAATALFGAGRVEEATATVERGLAAAPGSAALLQLLADNAIAAHRWSEARRRAEEIAPRSAGELANKHLLIARSLIGQERIGEAIERLRSAQAAQPERGDTLTLLSSLCEREGRLDEALVAVRRLATLPGAQRDAYAARISSLEAAVAARNTHRLE